MKFAKQDSAEFNGFAWLQKKFYFLFFLNFDLQMFSELS